MRTLGRSRTGHFLLRRQALFPLSYEGMVGAEGFEPTVARYSRVTAGPDSPTSARPRGVTDRDRTGVFQGHNLARQPLRYSHHRVVRTRGGS
jgi:hypothetical protein